MGKQNAPHLLSDSYNDTHLQRYRIVHVITLSACPRSEAWCISFLGMHPTLTQVPPSPQVLPVKKEEWLN